MRSLSFLILLLTFNVHAETPATYSGLINPCAEGRFLDVTKNQCKDRDKTFGFDRAAFNAALPAMVKTLTNCTESNFENALSDLKNNGGGTLNIAACTVPITKQHNLSSNILIQGKGAAKTTLKWQGGNSTPLGMLRMDGDNSRINNVFLRDFKIDGTGTVFDKTHAISISYVTNVMVERIHVRDIGRSAVSYQRTINTTVRYIYADKTGSHAFSSKDCYVKGDQTACYGDDINRMTIYAANYSNRIIDSGGSPSNSQIQYTEFAGNYMKTSRLGSKFSQPTRYAWIHDNHWEGARNSYSITFRTGLDYPGDMQNRWVAFYRNNVAVSQQELQVTDTADIYFIDNLYYSGNDDWTYNYTGQANTQRTSIFFCPDSQITQANGRNTGGTVTLTNMSGSDPRCNLSTVATLFD